MNKELEEIYARKAEEALQRTLRPRQTTKAVCPFCKDSYSYDEVLGDHGHCRRARCISKALSERI